MLMVEEEILAVEVVMVVSLEILDEEEVVMVVADKSLAEVTGLEVD